MVRRLINRLFGRSDPTTDAITAYVGGNASGDEVKLVEKMMRDDPALEKDLATQKTLVGVLGRITIVEAPRSFAITPEMVAAAEGSRSFISRTAELFAPQRKLALAPMVLAGFAALTVALLTLGDITGVVEQSGRRESFSAAAGAPGLPGEPGVPESAAAPAAGAATSGSSAEDSVENEVVITVVVEKAIKADSDDASQPEILSQAATAAPAATLAAAAVAPAAIESLESSAPGDDADAEAPSSLSAKAPAPEEDEVEPELSVEEQATQPERVEPADIAADDELELASPAGIGGGVADGAADGAGAGALAGAAEGAGAEAGKGLTLPVWQLQVALAALAVAAIGAWAGLRRIRGD